MSTATSTPRGLERALEELSTAAANRTVGFARLPAIGLAILALVS